MGEERPKRRVIKVRESCTFEERDGSWVATFAEFEVTGSGETQDDAFRSVIQTLHETIEAGGDVLKERWERYMEEHSEEQEIPEEEWRAQQEMIAASHEASKHFRQLDGSSLDEAIGSDVPVLVDFWAEWCMPCHMMAPVLEEVAEDLTGRMQVAKLDVDQHREVWERFKIEGIPTLILFRRGEEIMRIVGAGRPKEQMIEELEPFLG